MRQAFTYNLNPPYFCFKCLIPHSHYSQWRKPVTKFGGTVSAPSAENFFFSYPLQYFTFGGTLISYRWKMNRLQCPDSSISETVKRKRLRGEGVKYNFIYLSDKNIDFFCQYVVCVDATVRYDVTQMGPRFEDTYHQWRKPVTKFGGGQFRRKAPKIFF